MSKVAAIPIRSCAKNGDGRTLNRETNTLKKRYWQDAEKEQW